MLDLIFRSPKVVARLQSGPLAEILEGFAGYLSLRGNARTTTQEYVRSAAHLAHWLSVEAISPKKPGGECHRRTGRRRLAGPAEPLAGGSVGDGTPNGNPDCPAHGQGSHRRSTIARVARIGCGGGPG